MIKLGSTPVKVGVHEYLTGRQVKLQHCTPVKSGYNKLEFQDTVSLNCHKLSISKLSFVHLSMPSLFDQIILHRS